MIVAVKTKGKSQKVLLEERSALVKKAQAFHDKHEANWTTECEATHQQMMADCEHLALAVKQVSGALGAIGAIGGGSSQPVHGSGPRHLGGYRSGDVAFLASNERLTETPGFEAPVACGLGEAIRGMIAPSSTFANPEAMAFLGSGRDSTGGFSVPIELSSEVIDLARAKSQLISAGARTAVMKSEEARIARVESEPTMEVKAEGAAFSDATMTIGGVILKAFVIGAYMEVSRELASDAPNFARLVQEQLGKSLGSSLDRLGIQGTGSGEPVGLTIHPDVAETSGVGYPNWDDLSLATTEVRKRNHEPNSVVINPEAYDILRISKDGELRYLDPPATLAGKFWGDTNNCPLASAIVGDFSNMIWGIRQSPLIETSTVAGDAFKRHMVAIKVTWRGDWALTDATAFQRLAGITNS